MKKGREVRQFNELNNELAKSAISLLAKEFYSHRSVAEGVEVFEASLDQGNEIGLALVDDQEIVGFTTYKIYPFEAIRNQLFLETEIENNNISRIRMAPFGNLLIRQGFNSNYQIALELAYTTVPKEHRGKGHGATLFAARMDTIRNIQESAVIFDIARGIHAQHFRINQIVTEFLLKKEKEINGLSENGLINVQGLWVNTEDLGLELGLDLSELNSDAGAPATIHQCKKNGFKYIGFSRNLSPVWCRENK